MVRIFWIAIAILVAATAAAFLYPSNDTPEATLTSEQPATPQTSREPAPRQQADQYADAAPAETPAVPDGNIETLPQSAPEPEQTPDAAPADSINPPTNMPRPEDDQSEIQLDEGPGDPIASPNITVSDPTTPSDDNQTEDNQSNDNQKDSVAKEAQAETTDEPDGTPKEQSATADKPAPDSDQATAPAPTQSTDSETTADVEPDDEVAETESPIVEQSESDTSEPASPTNTDPAPKPASESTPQIAVTPRKTNPAETTPAPKPKPKPDPVVKTDTGLLLNGQWSVEGKGTKAAPYVIEWDMLVALQREYQPRLGQTEIPEWIKALNDKTVKIRGYALLPMGMSSMSELLVMLNQWDSCCIGVPPRPSTPSRSASPTTSRPPRSRCSATRDNSPTATSQAPSRSIHTSSRDTCSASTSWKTPKPTSWDPPAHRNPEQVLPPLPGRPLRRRTPSTQTERVGVRGYRLFPAFSLLSSSSSGSLRTLGTETTHPSNSNVPRSPTGAFGLRRLISNKNSANRPGV